MDLRNIDTTKQWISSLTSFVKPADHRKFLSSISTANVWASPSLSKQNLALVLSQKNWGNLLRIQHKWQRTISFSPRSFLSPGESRGKLVQKMMMMIQYNSILYDDGGKVVRNWTRNEYLGCGQFLVEFWSFSGQYLVKFKSNSEIRVQFWSKYGHIWVIFWSYLSQIRVIFGSSPGHIWVKFESNSSQILVKF